MQFVTCSLRNLPKSLPKVSFHFDMFAKCSNVFRISAFLRFYWKVSFMKFSIQSYPLTEQPHHFRTAKSRQNVFLFSKRLSHKLLCVYGVWWGWQAIIECTKMHFLSNATENSGKSLTQLNLFSIFNIKNMCLETTSFPCISVPIVFVFLNLDYIQKY